MSFVGNYWDGKNMTYNQSFCHTTFMILAPISAIIIGASIALALVIYFFNRKSLKKVHELRIQSTLLEGSVAPIDYEYPLVSKILDGISIGLFWLGLSLISILFPLLSGFDQIHGTTATIYLILTYFLGMFYQLWRMSIYQSSKYNFIQRLILVIKQFKILLGIQFIIYVSAAYILPYVFDKACICIYSTAYGLPIIMDMQFSTQLTRGYWFDKVCKDGQLCHFYATLPQDTMHEVIFNVHVGQDVDSLSIEIQNKRQYQKLPCQEFPFPKSIEIRGQRRIYACLFRNLLSGSDYDVSVYYKDQILKNSSYRTIPSSEDNYELVILFGGDYGYQEEGRQLARKVVNVDPHIILIGGDVTYDNGHIHCYYSNDLFLSIFEEQFDYMDRVVPFILSVGNHDVGFNDYANYNITVSDDYGPLYFVLFPQKQENGIIPDIKNRVTNNYHLIQNILLFGLDSGYLQTHESQVPWVKNISEQYPDFARIAHYHVPMYPTCFSNSSYMAHWENLVYAQKHWVPLFDELDFKAAFENHVHQYKRTYPLRQGQKSQSGTIYFGDGSMGVITEKCEEKFQTFLQGAPFENLFETVLVENSEHFWVLIADKYGRVQYEARSPNYDVIPNSRIQQRFFMPHDDL
ncbi:hypothetical protein pb186bvf_009401 [Paramecium bursaria]